MGRKEFLRGVLEPHEMTREEFESQPDIWFHGTPTGIIGAKGRPFHVGTREAATEALSGRVGAFPSTSAKKDSGHPAGWASSGFGEQIPVSHPDVVGGRIVGEMTNTPHFSPRRGPGRTKWEIREGVPRGEMFQWDRMSPSEPHSDVRANAIATRKDLKRGFYYVNAAEGVNPDQDESQSISAVLPKRSHFKTHEDYLVEARKAGKKIPKRAMKGYKQIPGQEKLF